ncbi:hypothetical protein EG68_08877 [Paragonimus skrjabini miyazakii]|uniref:Uncharacterized protein n=1 Tax=Paragonimus skrjabini miyazakii TaxID=59628 RepID=A0A8S9YPY5_9TREM|nr:hypothetical protein EG68_08877 [Paragonimus skrjabini miyazakii]
MACVWSQLPLYSPLPAIPLVQLASVSRRCALGVWAYRLVRLVHIVQVKGDLVFGQSWLRIELDTSTPTDGQQTARAYNPFRTL